MTLTDRQLAQRRAAGRKRAEYARARGESPGKWARQRVKIPTDPEDRSAYFSNLRQTKIRKEIVQELLLMVSDCIDDGDTELIHIILDHHTALTTPYDTIAAVISAHVAQIVERRKNRDYSA